VMLIGSDEHAHQQAVKVGIRQNDEVQIVEGLKEGQKIVTEGAYGLPNNAKVSAESPKEEKDEKDEKSSAGKQSPGKEAKDSDDK